jgi:hypothetical protein
LYSNPAIEEEDVQSSSHQRPAQVPETDSQNPEDTVHLSQGARIQQMSRQGESASAIASTTGLTASEVDSDLGISTTSSSVAVTAPSGHGGKHCAAAAAPASAAAAPAATSDSKTATPAPTLSVRGVAAARFTSIQFPSNITEMLDNWESRPDENVGWCLLPTMGLDRPAGMWRPAWALPFAR